MSYSERDGQVEKPGVCLCRCDDCMPRSEFHQDPNTKVRTPITRQFSRPRRYHCCGPECSKREEDQL
jgi:hypothetical protein